jgi:hypothetical protein
MTTKIIGVVAAVVAAAFFGAQGAIAAPMLCSGEQKICITACQ